MPYEIDETVTGQDATAKWGSTEFAVSTVSWNRNINTSEVQHNDDLNAKILTTGLRYDGSFEYSGRNWDLMNALVHQKEGPTHQANEPETGTLTVMETVESENDDGSVSTEKYMYTFTGVVVTGQSRDLPADDASSSSWDWQAEKMSVTQVVG